MASDPAQSFSLEASHSGELLSGSSGAAGALKMGYLNPRPLRLAERRWWLILKGVGGARCVPGSQRDALCAPRLRGRREVDKGISASPGAGSAAKASGRAHGSAGERGRGGSWALSLWKLAFPLAGSLNHTYLPEQLSCTQKPGCLFICEGNS